MRRNKRKRSKREVLKRLRSWSGGVVDAGGVEGEEEDLEEESLEEED